MVAAHNDVRCGYARGTLWSRGLEEWSMLTQMLRWLGHRFVGRAWPAKEFRADQMDGGWQTEYRHIGGPERPVPVRASQLFYR